MDKLHTLTHTTEEKQYYGVKATFHPLSIKERRRSTQIGKMRQVETEKQLQVTPEGSSLKDIIL